jgi:DNA (cytosine-5)-methyltransferase 1
MKLKTLDLFSGIGGFSLGLESTGFFETIGFVEKDKFCQKVLKKHWSNINIEEDIRNVKGEKYQADVVTGGFPCQPFSVAGKRKSTADDRYLWDEMLRVIRETKPRWVIGENVEGIVNINEGMVLRQVLNDLENEGFKSQCIIIPASGIGAWHQRKRIWIMAYSDSNRHVSEIRRGNGEEKRIPVQDREKDSTSRKSIGTSDVWQTNKEYVPNTSGQRSSSQSIGVNRELAEESKGEKETRNKSTLRTSSSCSDVPNSESKGLFSTSKSKSSSDERTRLDINKKKNWSEIWSYASRCDEQDSSRDVPNTSNEGLQRLNTEQLTSEQELRFTSSKDDEGRKTWWQTQSELCGTVDGLSYELDKDRSNRIKSLGNSIVPQIARQIGLSIMEAELNG